MVSHIFTDMSTGLQLFGTTLGVLGWLGIIISCTLPLWRVTAFIGTNIVTAQIMWEGLWMSCVVQSTGQMQCKVYDSMLALPQDLQASRAILIIASLVGLQSQTFCEPISTSNAHKMTNQDQLSLSCRRTAP
uniref:Claudin n=1 Tax=Cyprinus carpio TaxID=7962 RepID=A0A8C1U0B8_CYPCA